LRIYLWASLAVFVLVGVVGLVTTGPLFALYAIFFLALAWPVLSGIVSAIVLGVVLVVRHFAKPT
jgi:hypothetical protein